MKSSILFAFLFINIICVTLARPEPKQELSELNESEETEFITTTQKAAKPRQNGINSYSKRVICINGNCEITTCINGKCQKENKNI
ncbi:hypothetical protein PVAND_009794 [Polypedilum vanderplanki]|uniref:Uncharacterized protein n=1 Tax=Polypedilum vanderplanki TaxID=319348 RepID=A0A9J6CDU5_POLVA|nr:hypothetical protein PVAND_009794 [Polypedilum vanderplanki]